MNALNRWRQRTALAALVGVMATACGPTGPALRPLDDRAVKARQAVQGLSAAPEAAAVSDQIEQAKAWLARYEARRAAPSPDAAGLALLMDVIDGQLARAKTSLARMEAEARLKARQARYTAENARLEAVRRESAQLQATGGAR